MEKPKHVPVKMYTSPWCPFCIRAKKLLSSKGVAFEDIDVSTRPDLHQEMVRLSGRRTVPQIWIGSTHVGGCDDLHALQSAGKLDSLLIGK